MSPAPHREEPLVFLYRLKPGMGPEYDRAHKAVWPEIPPCSTRRASAITAYGAAATW